MFKRLLQIGAVAVGLIATTLLHPSPSEAAVYCITAGNGITITNGCSNATISLASSQSQSINLSGAAQVDWAMNGTTGYVGNFGNPSGNVMGFSKTGSALWQTDLNGNTTQWGNFFFAGSTPGIFWDSSHSALRSDGVNTILQEATTSGGLYFQTAGTAGNTSNMAHFTASTNGASDFIMDGGGTLRTGSSYLGPGSGNVNGPMVAQSYSLTGTNPGGGFMVWPAGTGYEWWGGQFIAGGDLDFVYRNTSNGTWARGLQLSPSGNVSMQGLFTNLNASGNYFQRWQSATSSGTTSMWAGNGNSTSGVTGCALGIDNTSITMLLGLDCSGNLGIHGDYYGVNVHASNELFANYLSIGGNGTGPTANVNIAGDMTVSRGANTGVVYLGTSGSHYVYFDGSSYQLPNGSLNVPNGNMNADTISTTHYISSGTYIQAQGFLGGSLNVNEDPGTYMSNGYGWGGGTGAFIMGWNCSAGQGEMCFGNFYNSGEAATASAYRFYQNSSLLVNFTRDGIIHASNFYNDSRRSLKTNIVPMSKEYDALKVIDGTNFVCFNYKRDVKKFGKRANQYCGFIADDTDKHLAGKKHDHFDPEAMSATDGRAIQQLHAKLTTDEARIAKLEKEVAYLQAVNPVLSANPHHKGLFVEVWDALFGTN